MQKDPKSILLKELEKICLYYSPKYPVMSPSGKPVFFVPHLDETTVDEFIEYVSELQKTQNTDELRYEILSRIYRIPSQNAAISLHIENVEKRISWLWEDPEKNYMLIDDIQSRLDEARRINYFQSIEDYESRLKILCDFFQINRRFVSSDEQYKSINLSKYRNGFSDIKHFLLGKYILKEQWQSLENLIRGGRILEPIEWLGNKSSLNRFIVALYRKEPGIPWQEWEKLFLINEEHPKNLRTVKPKKEIPNPFSRYFPPLA